MRRGYVDGVWGQVHYREAGGGRVLACLHATAYSSRSLVPFLDRMSASCRAVGLDTPGYGQSDPPPAQATVDGYAGALADAIAALADGPADLFGYHTGALLAAAIAAARPALVRRLVLVGVPAFTDAERPAWRTRLVRPASPGLTLDEFGDRWAFLVSGRPAGMALPRAVGNFADELQAWPHESRAHAALFEHDAAGTLAAVRAPTLVVNPPGPLADASRRAAGLIPGARVVEAPGLTGALFDAHSGALAGIVEPFLV